MERAVRAALKGREPADRAAGELALTYARAIDHGDDLVKLGPALLSALESLLLTPKARATILSKGGQHGPATSPLDELRARRARRDRTTAVDATGP